MELSEVINTQFAFHGIVVGLVLVCAVLVFVFGFKSVEEFPFDKLTNAADDRKPAGKKRKVKDKKVQSNGHATAVGSDKGDSKQKTDNAAAKGKSATKDKRDVEKVPAKELSRVVGKQEKKQQVKAEPSPNKTALKETKNIKDNKKNITDESQKQIKEKKGDSSGKDITKTKQVAKNKGKENVEVKNKKNTEKATQKAKLGDDKPKEEDEGEWEQAVYRKDKKKKAAAADDEIISDKSVKKDVSSPAKKKKSKSAENAEKEQVTNITTPVAEASPASVEIEQVKSDSTSNKEQKQAKKELKKDKVKSSEEIVNGTEVTPVDTEGDAKSGTKKKKKKSGKENVENNTLPVEKDVPLEQPVSTSAPSKPKKVEVRATVEAKPASSQTKPEVMTENTAVFDELGDVWKEAKAPKKSNKKKVRKDQ